MGKEGIIVPDNPIIPLLKVMVLVLIFHQL